MPLSKSDFLLFLNAPMHLWAKAHAQLALKMPTPYEQHLRRQGQQVEAFAKAYITSILLPQYAQAQLLWQREYANAQYMIRTDALLLDQDAGAYDLVEIKSSTSIHTEHEYDLTFQVLLLETILKLRHVYILHINKTYQHNRELDLARFFTTEELSEAVEKRRGNVNILRQEALAVMQAEIPLSDYACTKPKTCPCLSLCHPDLPNHPIYDIPYIGKKAKRLREMGVTDIKDIPSTFKLNDKQQKYYQAVKSEKALIDREAVRAALTELTYPLHFLDYETFNPAVPLFAGYRPYEHIVFQYSLFIIQEPNAEPKHFEYLLTEKTDPAPTITPHLLEHIQQNGSVIVWNQSFEAHRNLDLAGHCPQYAGQLKAINDRLYDLMLIFKKGLYVHPDFHGSASLKSVLPVLCPTLGYDDMAINNGEAAMLAWYDIQTGKIPPEQRHEIEAAMLAYCKLDTYGMVAIWEKLRSL